MSDDPRNAAISAVQSQSQRSSTSAVEPAAAASTSPAMPRDLARLLELAQRIRFGSAPQTAATRAELSWLGVDESQLKLAQGAVDKNPQVRREVVEALPSIAHIDARGWLLWLSRDRDAEVRRAAIALLATAGDPELKKRVREAAESDADPRVRQQAKAAVMAESNVRQ
jgi:HEAT repeat protein